ncbi:MAG: hypothetical protein ACD_51C00248G0007 [uncultured bacterium]|nr:MAG: hypothetical protein ACD_51C00248G0007 [uncultured bacterium]OGJ47815.1 MAG: hypothetical protein A2244_04240 [Candidatus Peregrinibacteria bacterium RIFOXYA2_FULL_41_18]OGJ48371.1 MAG: hypothetical protein A2344_05190 [Candidatus Peregrinibacteria bacterium RIFOXYB12_FULL_41_12]OGJ53010.1 MAG: hypothetical protein A2448_04360 [Candidatus Peregrinibacteria bacterium RIFOXYC2_FULL_41_22]
MKKYILGLALVLIAAIGGWKLYDYLYVPCCEPLITGQQDVADVGGDVLQVDSMLVSDYVFSVQDNYGSDLVSSAKEVSLETTGVYDMNSYLGLPDGNTLKTHSVCYDESIGQGYIAGIMSSEIAVFKDDETFAYVDTGVGVGGFVIKDVFCDGGIVLSVTEDSVVKIDGITLEVLDMVSFDKKVFYQSTYFDIDNGVVAFPVPDSETYEIYDLETMDKVGSIPVNKGAVFYMSDGSILGIDTVIDDSGYDFNIFDSEDFSKKDSDFVENKFGIKDFAYNKNSGEVLMLTNTGQVFVYDMNDLNKKPYAIDTGIKDPNRIVANDDYIVAMTENGFDYEGYGDFLGGIVIIDAKTKEVLNTVEIPTHHTNIELDDVSNMAYVTNNGDNSVSRVNLATGEVEAVIDAGSSVEGGAVLADGSLYLRNRLGGNSIMRFDPETGDFNNIECEYPWPVGIAYSENLGKAFAFDFLNSSISQINPETDELEAVYDLPVNDGATDGIGDMAYDYTRDVAYVAIPEQNSVVAVDMVTGNTIKVVQVEDYLQGGSYDDLGGAGVLVIATYEPTAKLLVYVKKVSKIFVYDGLNGFELDEVIDVGDLHNDIENFPYSLVVDQTGDRIYIGSKIYAAETYELIGSLAYGNSVALADWDAGILFTVSVNDKKNDQETLYALSYYDGELLGQLDLSSNQYVKPRFAYDKEKGVIYAFYMVSSEVWEISISSADLSLP